MSTSAQSIAERVMVLVGRKDMVSQPWFASGAGRVEHGDEIDAAVAEEARRRAEQALNDARRNGDSVQAESARIALAESLVRIQVARRRRTGVPVD